MQIISPRLTGNIFTFSFSADDYASDTVRWKSNLLSPNANDPKAKLHAKLDRIEHGYGLKNMNRRLAEIGGACEIYSEPERGTTVKFTVPLRP